MNSTRILRIRSIHATVAEAVKAAGLERPMYETALAENIRLSDKGSARHGMSPCTRAFVVEPFSRTAEIYGDKAEVLYVTEHLTACPKGVCRYLNKVELNGCICDTPLALAVVKEKEMTIEITGPFIPKTPAGRNVLHDMQETGGAECYGTNL